MPRDKDVKRVVRKRMAATGERYTEARTNLGGTSEPRTPVKGKSRTHNGQAELVEVEIPVNGGIRMDLRTGQHFAVMKERDSQRSLSIWIGMTEANAIAMVLNQMSLERPITADLLSSTIRAFGGEVDRVVITRFASGCFYAEVDVHREGAPRIVMDARPSDALGIAVRAAAPIFVASDIMARCGIAFDALPTARMWVPSTLGEPSPHVVVDAATDQELLRLDLQRGIARMPEVGVLLTLGTPQASRQYRVVAVEPAADGVTRLMVELEHEPSVQSTYIFTIPNSPQG